MHARIRMGEGNVEVAQGDQDGIPVLILAPSEVNHPVGEKAGEPDSQISAEDLDKRQAIVIEFPAFKSVDVVLYELMGLWQRSKEAQWDKPAEDDYPRSDEA